MSSLFERTLVIIKPDGVSRGLIGEIISRFERKGLSIAGLKLINVSNEAAEAHYAEHKAKPFFPSLTSFITSAPVVVAAVEGNSAVSVIRNLVGPTSGLKAEPGTIRGDYSLSMQNNLIHASDSLESAKRELSIWFGEGELVAPGKGSGKAGYEWVNSSEDRAKSE